MSPNLKKTFLTILLASTLSSCFFNTTETLNISSTIPDEKLIKNVKKNYGAKKLRIINEHCNYQKALKYLNQGTIDVFIGSLNQDLFKQNNLDQSFDNYTFARDGLLVVTNPKNKIDNLSSKQLKKIFLRKINNWKTVDLKAKSSPIVVIDYAKGNETKEAFYHQVLGSSTLVFPNTITVNSTKEIHDAIRKFPNAVSYLNFSEYQGDLRKPQIDNIPADEINIQKGYFPLSRDIQIVFNTRVLKKNNKFSSLKDLLSYLLSSKGQAVLSAMNYIPLTSSEIESIQLKANPFYIGVAVPLEGTYSELGRSILSAAKLAVEDVNRRGGIETKDLEIIVCNDKADPDLAVDCAKNFVKEGVMGVIGHLTSQSSIEASKVYAKNKIVQITPASTHPWFTERPGARDYAFRTIGRDDKQAKLIAETIADLDIIHPSKVSILNNSTIYGSTLSTLIENEITKIDKDEVLEIKALKPANNQYHNEVNELESKVIVFVGEYGDAAQIIKELALSNKKDIVFIGADGTFSHSFIEEAGLRAEGAFVTGSTVDNSDNQVDKFKEEFKMKFKQEASAYALNSYDATMLLSTAIEKSYKEDISMSDAVKATRHEGLTGLIYFNSIGDPVLPRMSMYQVQNEEFIRLK